MQNISIESLDLMLKTSLELANEKAEYVKALSTLQSDLETVIPTLWKGDAQATYNRKMIELCTEALNYGKVVEKHANNLAAMHKEYVNADTENESISQSLVSTIAADTQLA